MFAVKDVVDAVLVIYHLYREGEFVVRKDGEKVVIIKLGEHAPYSIVKIEINRDKTSGPIDIFCSLPSRE